jgi:hypothetical protein
MLAATLEAWSFSVHGEHRATRARPMFIVVHAVARNSHPRSSLLLAVLMIGAGLVSSASSASGKPSLTERNSNAVPQQDKSENGADSEVPTYLDETPKRLLKQVKELKGFQPAADQQILPMILKKTGEEVDQFLKNVVDVVAEEEIKQERDGISSSRKPSHDNYLILRHGEGTEGIFDEFRMDEEGNRLDASPRRGFLITTGFALTCLQFSTAMQPASKFRYLGDQKIAKKETYVVAFAQMPGETGMEVTMRGPGGEVHMELQGIAWVDKESFHILRIRTDLLEPEPRAGLEEQTTKVNFSEVQLQDVATPLWLPQDVVVNLKLSPTLNRPFEVEFKNVHHYTNYRRYRVTTKIVSPE